MIVDLRQTGTAVTQAISPDPEPKGAEQAGESGAALSPFLWSDPEGESPDSADGGCRRAEGDHRRWTGDGNARWDCGGSDDGIHTFYEAKLHPLRRKPAFHALVRWVLLYPNS